MRKRFVWNEETGGVDVNNKPSKLLMVGYKIRITTILRYEVIYYFSKRLLIPQEKREGDFPISHYHPSRNYYFKTSYLRTYPPRPPRMRGSDNSPTCCPKLQSPPHAEHNKNKLPPCLVIEFKAVSGGGSRA